MKQLFGFIFFLLLFLACKPVTLTVKDAPKAKAEEANVSKAYTAEEIKAETLRAWNAYRDYAWGYDVLLPLSKTGSNWYEESLGISPFDAYSTLAVMGLNKEAKEVEEYALAKNWDQDVYVLSSSCR